MQTTATCHPKGGERDDPVRRQPVDPVHRAARCWSGRRPRSRRASTRSSSGGRGRSPCPSDAEVDAFVAAVTDAGVQLVGPELLRRRHARRRPRPVSWPARSSEFRDNVDVTVGLGERLGCRAFNALYGNRIDDATPEEQDALAAENLALAARAARRIGGTVLVEPVSGAPRYPLLTAADALARDRPGRRRTTSRCCSTSTTSRSTATTSTPRSTRARPAGSGTCRSPTPPAATSPAPGSSTSTPTSTRIAATGYDGWVGLEYKPSGAERRRLRLAAPRAPVARRR